MSWFVIGVVVFFVVNFGLTLAFRRWGLTAYSFTDQWDPGRRHD
jgi:hypothetical protein